MKSKLLLIIIFLISVRCYAQSVPNTSTFTLQNVVDVTGGTSLTAAYTNSIDSYFDTNYKGSKNSLLNFRNYHATTEQQCRPTGLTTKVLLYHINCYGADPYHLTEFDHNFSGSWANAASALYVITLGMCDGDGGDVQGTTFAVSDTIYLGTGIDCSYPADGWYLIEVDNEDDLIYHIESGVITEKITGYI